MRFSTRYTLSAVAGLLLAATQIAPAAENNYGNFMANNVIYEGVSEFSDDPEFGTLGLYRAPSVTGDTLEFDTIPFEAVAGENEIDDVKGKLHILRMNAKPGISITDLTVLEGVSLSVSGLNQAEASVFAPLTVKIHGTTGSPMLPSALIFDNLELNFATDFISLPGPPKNAQGNGSLTLDLDAMLAGEGFAGESATSVEIILDNQLSAVANDLSSATASKRSLSITPVTAAVPEPSTMALAALGICGLGALALRRRLKK